MADITFPPELLPDAENPETAEIIVGGRKLDLETRQQILELRGFNAICKHLIDVINTETYATKH